MLDQILSRQDFVAVDKETTVSPEEALINRCLSGDDTAYVLLYQQFSAMIYRLCYGMLHDREDAEEVMQDSFEYAFRKLSMFDSSKSAFKTWLYRIAISRCRNKRRRKTFTLFSIDADDGRDITDESRTPSQWFQLTEKQAEVWGALQKLTPKLRETAILRYYDGLKYDEIGAILGIPGKTAESRMRLAHKALREILSEDV